MNKAANYTSGSDSDFEEFFMARVKFNTPEKDKKKDKAEARPKGTDIIVSVPTGVGIKKNMTLLGLIDTGSSALLASREVVSL